MVDRIDTIADKFSKPAPDSKYEDLSGGEKPGYVQLPDGGFVSRSAYDHYLESIKKAAEDIKRRPLLERFEFWLGGRALLKERALDLLRTEAVEENFNINTVRYEELVERPDRIRNINKTLMSKDPIITLFSSEWLRNQLYIEVVDMVNQFYKGTDPYSVEEATERIATKKDSNYPGIIINRIVSEEVFGGILSTIPGHKEGVVFFNTGRPSDSSISGEFSVVVLTREGMVVVSEPGTLKDLGFTSDKVIALVVVVKENHYDSASSGGDLAYSHTNVSFIPNPERFKEEIDQQRLPGYSPFGKVEV